MADELFDPAVVTGRIAGHKHLAVASVHPFTDRAMGVLCTVCLEQLLYNPEYDPDTEEENRGERTQTTWAQAVDEFIEDHRNCASIGIGQEVFSR